jgi:hypothetical protein
MFSAMSLFYLVWAMAGDQLSATSPNWAALASDSTAVIVGIAERQMAVVHTDRIVTHSKALPDGKVLVELPNRADYMEGRVVRIRVIEVLKRDARVKAHGVISVFVPGASLTDLSPALEEGERYLVFLNQLAPDPSRFAGATIHHDAPSTWEERFTPASQYVIVGETRGLVHLTDENIKLIDQVRAVLLTARG